MFGSGYGDMTRVALYARVSTRDKGQDYENQLTELREFVGRHKGEWEIVEEYVDMASGKSGDRDSFKRMFEDASRRKFDMLVFWSLDRFSREGVLETLQYLQRLTSYKVDWFSYREEYLRSIGVFRDAVLAILATIAKQERIRLGERTRAGLQTARNKGKRLGRPKAIVDTVVIRELREKGISVREIGKKFGVSRATINRVIKERL